MSDEVKTVIQVSKFTILTVNDIYEVIPNIHGIGGLAELCTVINKEKAGIKDCLVTMNGDFLSASALGIKLKGKNMVDIFNTMPFDIVSLGNHEFDFGSDVTIERIKETRKDMTYLNSNIFEKEGNKLLTGTTEHLIQTLETGVKVGYFAVCTDKTPALSQPGDKVHFEDVVACSKRMIKLLEEQGCDCIVAVTHLDIEADKELASSVKGIHVILGGHDHSPYILYQGETFIIKSGQNSNFLTKIDFVIEKKTFTFDGETFSTTWVFPDLKMMLVRGYEPDKKTLERVNYYQDQLPKDSGDVICMIKRSLDTGRERVRSKEANFCNLVCDSLKDYFKTDLAFIAGGAIRGDSHYTPGTKFTKGDLEKEMPFPDKLSVVEITGADLYATIEIGVANCPAILGSFPHVSHGFMIEYDEEAKPGNRVTSLHLNGKDVHKEDKLTCAGTAYIMGGGDGFTSFKNAKVIQHEVKGIILRDIVAIYMKKLKIIDYNDYEYRIYKKGTKNLWKFVLDNMKK